MLDRNEWPSIFTCPEPIKCKISPVCSVWIEFEREINKQIKFFN